MMRALLISLLLTTPAMAQDGPAYDTGLLSACLKTAGDRPQDCIGKASDACMSGPDGSTTVGTGACLSQEGAEWDRLLNAAYGKALAEAKAADAELKELGSAAPPAAPALHDAQRKWIAFRDASCQFAALQFQGGTGGGPAASACIMELTAQQALRLRALSREQGQ